MADPAASPAPATVNEYERERVPEHALKGPSSFWGMYAGEHTAGTEFMLGPLFIAWGASAADVIVGLLLGNLLAVLTWRYLTAPIATDLRMTLYYKLEKICGRNLVSLYNLANGVLFCFLAGAMVTVSATAVGVPFPGVKMPTFADTMPTGLAWCAVVVILGALQTVVAVKGYSFVARVGHLAAPWMFLVFVACGLVMLPKLASLEPSKIWTGVALGGGPGIGFAGIMLFAWLCNAAMHLGMSDMSIFRYARKPSSGWAASAGMFLGHYVAWICASLLFAYELQQRGAAASNAPGPMVYAATGWAGLICVVIAGWTTANPTIYRAGLAFQGVLPAMSRNTGTIIAGALATVAGLFPAFAMKLLDFVGIYGTVLSPVGAIIVVDHYLARRLGLTRDWADSARASFNLAALLAWVIPVGVFFWLYRAYGIFPSYLTVPVWLACGVLYILFSKILLRNPPPAAA
ncbi:MAG: purine-cytosine permease family protein [Verrucomicrobiota bacterium]